MDILLEPTPFNSYTFVSSMTIQNDTSDVGKTVDRAAPAKPLTESDAKLISTDNRHFSMVR